MIDKAFFTGALLIFGILIIFWIVVIILAEVIEEFKEWLSRKLTERQNVR